ncbi:MAG: hypothetical protein ACLTDF_09585 [Coprococcus sp.]
MSLAVHGTGAYTLTPFHGCYVLELSRQLGVIMTTGRDCTVMITKSNSDKTFELAESALDIQGRSNSMSSLSSDKKTRTASHQATSLEQHPAQTAPNRQSLSMCLR